MRKKWNLGKLLSIWMLTLGMLLGCLGSADTVWAAEKKTSITAAEDTFVSSGSNASKTGKELLDAETDSNVKDRLRLKNSNAADQTYTRRIALKFDLTELATEGMGKYILTFQTHDTGNNPGADFSYFNIYTFEKEGWSRADLTWTALDGVLSQTADYKAATVTAANQTKEVQLTNKTYIYEADVTDAVEKALAEAKKEISFAFVIADSANNNQYDIFSVTTTRENVLKPSLMAQEAEQEPDQPQEPEGPGEDYEGTTYYVSNSTGSDENDGLSEDSPWKSLDKVNETAFWPGDQILFKAGDIWNGYLRPSGNGTKGKEILLSSYGDIEKEGRPIINGGGTTYGIYSATIMLTNQQYWTISNFEITNYGKDQEFGKKYLENYVRAGIYLYTYDQENLMYGLTVEHCYVHDVVSNTTNNLSASAKISGGIIAMAEYRTAEGEMVGSVTNNTSGFADMKLQYNTVYRTMHEGIRTKVEGKYNASNPDAYNRTCKNISINNNYIENTLGDGIVLGEICEGAVVEKNVVKNAAGVSVNDVYYAAIWTHYATDVLFQYNEVYGTIYGQTDGQAFDADNFCYNTTVQYNYSHDNQGGAMLLMGTQTGTVYRYNVSANDATGGGQEIFQDHTNRGVAEGSPTVYNNTFYIVKDNVYLFSSRNTRNSAEYVTFVNNIVDVKEGVTSTNFSYGSGIAGESVITNNLFAYEGLFGINDTEWPGNYYGDPDLYDPEAYLTHSAGLKDGSRTMAQIEELKEDPLESLRDHVSAFEPWADELVLGKGAVIEDLDLTEDIMGNEICQEEPSLGAIELWVNPDPEPDITVEGVNRLAGTDRNATSRVIADELKKLLRKDAFETVIIATGRDNKEADALTGSCLAKKKEAPILMTNGTDKVNAQVTAYIRKNAVEGAKVYILGGEAAVPETLENGLKNLGYDVDRLAGKDRYETNQEILKEAGLTDQTDLLIAVGNSYADSLSASATGRAILLVKPEKEGQKVSELTAEQKAVLAHFEDGNIYILGGGNAVGKATVEMIAEAAGKTAAELEKCRLSGKDRYATSRVIAEKFFTDAEYAVAAYGKKAADGLCGGILASTINAPLLLTKDGNSEAAAYTHANDITSGYVLGGTAVIPEKLSEEIFSIR